MASKDQTIGAVILIVCVLGITIYGWLVFLAGEWISLRVLQLTGFVAILAILGIGAWIGWTMATTPPPKPIEELEAEIEAETSEEEKVEEKIEETVVDQGEEVVQEVVPIDQAQEKVIRKKKSMFLELLDGIHNLCIDKGFGIIIVLLCIVSVALTTGRCPSQVQQRVGSKSWCSGSS